MLQQKPRNDLLSLLGHKTITQYSLKHFGSYLGVININDYEV